MSIEIDKKGYPILKEDKLDFAVVDPDTKSGNPFHDAQGRFTFAPPGMQVLGGKDLLKGLSPPTRKLFFQRSTMTRANQVSARVIDGNLHIVLLRDGRRLDNFAVAPKDVQKGKDGEGIKGQPIEETPDIRDIAIDAARAGLKGEALITFLEKRGVPANRLPFVEDLVERKRLDDLVDYLHQTLRKKVHKEDQIDRIRIAVGRGFLKSTFAGLDEAQTRIVLQRLQGRGWSEDVVQGALIKQMPARLQKVFGSVPRIARGKEQIREAQKETPKPS